ncbi:50S ribosomal protein L11 methyltransferase [bacterium]|nr:50S ribosomal protein L11 methyltransferase [bacterium]
MQSTWYEFRLSVNPELKEILSDKLFELGAEAVNENVDSPNELQSYFPAEQKLMAEEKIAEFWSVLKTNNPNLIPLLIQVLEVPDENWSESYKKFYYAQHLTDLFFLKPKWDNQTAIPLGSIPIIMDPGQAFGTGLHPSTRLCLRTLQSQILDNTRREQLKCLDVGTGTGILALAAYHLGVQQVVAVDNDPIAVEVAKENFELNNIGKIEVSTTDIKQLTGPFDFVISNILLETHRELSNDYSRLVPEGGLLLLSGLLGYQIREVFQLMGPKGFINIERRNYQEWASLLFIKRRSK